MSDEARAIDPQWAWEAYRPSKETPWNLARVGHLYRRATFGPTMGDLKAGLDAGPEKAVEDLLRGGPGQADFDAVMAPLGDTVGRTNNPVQLVGWWLYRMLYSPHPLQEKVTLCWHNHFATSNAKVQNARFMLGQYELMRKHSLGNFAAMLRDISRDPAMLIWLDTRGSKKGNPNENYARELMELFSLGIGNYTEKDIREAARAFTGWDIQGTEAVFKAGQHDDGVKNVLGQSGKFQGADIVRICLEQKACASFIVAKLYRFLISETAPATPQLLAPLADDFRKSDYDLAALIRRMLRSNLFFSPHAYRTRVKPPVDFALGIVRGLEGRIGTTALSAVLAELGQNVFNPPSVKGWDGGPAWLNGQTLLFRQNLALALTSTEDNRFGRRTDPAALIRKQGLESEEAIVDFFVTLFFQQDIAAATRESLIDYLRQARKQPVPAYWTAEDAADHRVRALCHLVLTLPEFQLS